MRFNCMWLSLFAFLLLSTTILLGAPSVTNINPYFGPSAGNTVVTISGSGFTGATAVSFGDTPASFVVNSDSVITASSPAHAPEVVSVTVQVGSTPSSPTPDSLFVYQGNWQAYVTNSVSNNVSVINVSTDSVLPNPIPVGNKPVTVGITPDGTKAFILNFGSNNVSVIQTSNDTVIATVGVGANPASIGITPNGTKAYVVNLSDQSASVINLANETVSATVGLGTSPASVGITPDGTKAYIVNLDSNNVSVINTSNDSVIATVGVGTEPASIVITPDGTKAYVTNFNSNNVSVINTASQAVVDTVTVGNNPSGIGMTPDGTKVYISNEDSSNNVSVIQTSNDTVIATVGVGSDPASVIITPDGTQAYVNNIESNNISVINTSNNTVVATPSVSSDPTSIAITPDGTKAYVTNLLSNNVSVINTSNQEVMTTLNVGMAPFTIAITPDQAPLAKFIVKEALAGSASLFDASGSLSPVGTISNYFWEFGDGTTLNTSQPIVSHLYQVPGVYSVTLTVTNSAGTSTSQIFNLSSFFGHNFFGSVEVQASHYEGGQVTHNGGPSAVLTQSITILPPAPIVEKIHPKCGSTAGGTEVTVKGKNFTGATAVFFGCRPALKFKVKSDTTIKAITPPEADGHVPVRVETPSGKSAKTSAGCFAYVAPPEIKSLSPSSGSTSGGTEVTITGKHLKGTKKVFFGSTPALDFIVESDRSIMAIAPPGNAGSVHVRIKGKCHLLSEKTKADRYTYVAPSIIEDAKVD